MFAELPFVKMSGAGNDFIILAEQDCSDVDPSWLATRLCKRALSVGADGLILIAPVDREAVRIRFYNPDGSLAEMCGNGSRCAARYAVEQRLVDAERFRLLTDSGDLDVIVRPDGRYEVAMPHPVDVRLDLMWIDDAQDRLPVHAARVGVPHAVVIAPDVGRFSDDQLIALGRHLRYHANFPEGTNVNFATIRPDQSIHLRTYERGVEDLTKACGTGSTATAYVARTLLDRPWPVHLTVDGGRLTIDARDDQYWLIGDARLIACGVIPAEAVRW